MTPVEPWRRNASTARCSTATAWVGLPWLMSAKPSLLRATGLSAACVVAADDGFDRCVGAAAFGAVVVAALDLRVALDLCALALALAVALALWRPEAAPAAVDLAAVDCVVLPEPPLSRPPTAIATAEAATSRIAATTPTVGQRRGGRALRGEVPGAAAADAGAARAKRGVGRATEVTAVGRCS